MVAWIYLLAAALLEMSWPVGMRWAERSPKYWPTGLILLLSLASFCCLWQAVRTIPVGTGYAVWTGVGAAGATLLGILLYGESASPARLGCIALILIGVVGLKLTSGH